MTPDDWQRVKEIFQAALDLPRPERAEYVRIAAADDIDLRREVVVFVRQGTAATATEAAADRRRRAVPCALVASGPFDGVLGKGHERGRYAACVPSAAFAMAEIGRQRLAMGLEANRTAKTMPASELRDHEGLPYLRGSSRCLHISELPHPVHAPKRWSGRNLALHVGLGDRICRVRTLLPTQSRSR